MFQRNYKIIMKRQLSKALGLFFLFKSIILFFGPYEKQLLIKQGYIHRLCSFKQQAVECALCLDSNIKRGRIKIAFSSLYLQKFYSETQIYEEQTASVCKEMKNINALSLLRSVKSLRTSRDLNEQKFMTAYLNTWDSLSSVAKVRIEGVKSNFFLDQLQFSSEELLDLTQNQIRIFGYSLAVLFMVYSLIKFVQQPSFALILSAVTGIGLSLLINEQNQLVNHQIRFLALLICLYNKQTSLYLNIFLLLVFTVSRLYLGSFEILFFLPLFVSNRASAENLALIFIYLIQLVLESASLSHKHQQNILMILSLLLCRSWQIQVQSDLKASSQQLQGL